MTDTKQITFDGQEYTVPVWVEWVARDEDGCKAGFETKPDILDDAFNNEDGRRFAFLGDPNLPDWRDSLTKV